MNCSCNNLKNCYNHYINQTIVYMFHNKLEVLSKGSSKLKVPLDDEMINKILHYLEILQRWNSLFNLTSISQNQWVEKHILDSLSTAPFFAPLFTLPSNSNFAIQVTEHPIFIADIGSGAGLPGIPLAIATSRLSGINWVLVEKIGKKYGFLTRVILELELANVTVVNNSVEEYGKKLTSNLETKEPAKYFNATIGRSVAHCIDLCRLSYPLLMPSGFVISMRGHTKEQALALAKDTSSPHNKNWELVSAETIRVPYVKQNRNIILWRKK